MGKIGGNKYALIQVLTSTRNAIAEDVPKWFDAVLLTGWLDLETGNSDHMNYHVKMQESTHIFLCDYVPLLYLKEGEKTEITAENSRIIIDNKKYEVMLYDDPMELHEQLEIYLKYIGGG